MCKVKAFSLVVVLILSHIIYTGYPGQIVTGVPAAESENLPPLVEIVPDVSSGKAPLIVHFDGDVSDDGEILLLEWDFEGDGTFEVTRNIPRELKGDERLLTIRNELKKEFTYTKAGIYHVLLRVTDDKEESCVSSVTIQVYSDVPWLDIVPCSNEFAYMARAGYEVFFANGITGKESVRFQVRDTWISYTMRNQIFEEVNRAKGVPSGNQ
ncbi:MAG: PKD domain-containing protein, partial [Theionarchaea archaeon]|nr:PKD domain-containing protein [Theionarchaea archaeon]